MVLLSVIIATCGRPERLARCLDAVGIALRTWGGEGEVFVVDNHPEYAAEAVVGGPRSEVGGRRSEVGGPRSEVGGRRSEFGVWRSEVGLRSSDLGSRSSDYGSHIHCLRSEPFNKAKALNAGIAAAKGEWLVFTDDDTLPDPNWLRVGMACVEWREWRVMGGRVVTGPDPADLPRWLKPGRSRRVPGLAVRVAYDPTAASGVLPANAAAPFGANLFCRKAVFAENGGYDEALWDLCRRKWPLGVEDSEFGHRLKLRGETVGYCREAVVVHPVNCDRASVRLHLRRAYCDGWRQPLIFVEEKRPWFEPFRLAAAMRYAGSAIADGVHGDPAGAVDSLMQGLRMAGSIAGRWSAAYRQRRMACDAPVVS